MSEYLQTVFDKFKLRVRKGCHYTEDGIWASVEGTKARIGLTDYTQRTGGDIAFVELVKKGTTVDREAEIGTLETAKTTVTLLSPLSGTVEKVNARLVNNPELVNSDPYGEGWLVTLLPRDLEDDLKTLISADAYFESMLKKLETDHGKLESR